jgi:bifunctional ADP-heptose synthase (sugar kinase/adenylyltransferase)
MSEPPTSVLVLGDSWLNRRVVGQNDGPNFVSTSVSLTAGGAAHVALSLAARGRKVQVVTTASSDADGGSLFDTCKEKENLWPRFIWVADYTPVRETFVTRTGEILRHVRPSVVSPTTAESQLRPILSDVVNVGPVPACVLLDGDAMLSPRLIRDVIRTWPTFVNTQADRLVADIYGGVGTVVISHRAALRWACLRNLLHPALDPNDPVSIAEVVGQAMQRELSAHMVVITCGRFGAVATLADQPQRHIRPETVLTVWDGNSTAESFLAGFVEGTLSGMQLEAALTFANRLGLLAARTDGPTIVTNDAVDDWLLESRPPESKQATVVQAAQMRHRLQARGRRVALISGTWDYFHAGHRYLVERAEVGNVLIALVKTTGEQMLLTRLRALAGINDVAIVVPVDDVEAAIREIRPNIIYLGEEHRGQAAPGVDFVARHGGDVQFVPMQPVAPHASSSLHPSS